MTAKALMTVFVFLIARQIWNYLMDGGTGLLPLDQILITIYLFLVVIVIAQSVRLLIAMSHWE